MTTITLILYCISMSLMFILYLSNRKSLKAAIIGADGKLDLIDLVKLLWLILFPVGFLSALFLQLVVSEMIWLSLDAIFFMLILKDGSTLYISKMNSKNEKDNSNSSDSPQ